jgi:hypothetical protein
MATLNDKISRASRLLEGKTLAMRLHLKSQEKADREAKALIGECLQELPKSSSSRIHLESAAEHIDEITQALPELRELARANAIQALTSAGLTLVTDAALNNLSNLRKKN